MNLQILWNRSSFGQRVVWISIFSVLFIGISVILFPSLFYFEQTAINNINHDHHNDNNIKSSNSQALAISPSISALTEIRHNNADRLLEIEELIKLTESEILHTKKELEALESQHGWFSPPPTKAEKAQIEQYKRELNYQLAVKAELKSSEVIILERTRALTPIFSEFTFQEAKAVFIKGQKQTADNSVWWWKMDVLFDTLSNLGGNSRDDLLTHVIIIFFKLIWNLTAGIIIGVIDFIIRIPFYIKEYGFFDNNYVENNLSPEELETLFPSLTAESHSIPVESSHKEKLPEVPQSRKAPKVKTGKAKVKSVKQDQVTHRSTEGLSLYDDEFLSVWRAERDQLEFEREGVRAYTKHIYSTSFMSRLKAWSFWIIASSAAIAAGILLCSALFVPIFICWFFASRNRGPIQNHED